VMRRDALLCSFIEASAPRFAQHIAAGYAMNDILYFCPTCKTIYEIVRHRIRPPAQAICERRQEELPVAEDGDWLTYRRTHHRFEPAR
jgi:hypothetical protein